jgi:type IV pilus assembly protein PilW
MSRIRLHSRERGVTLIELMVALAIGMVLSLAMFLTLSAAEGRKRTTTSTSDVNQAGNYALVLLDQWLRNAGNGFSKSAAYSFGCTLKAYRGNTQILPTVGNAALPSPFGRVNIGSDSSTVGQFRLAPVLILPGQTKPGVSASPSDVLVIMGGAAGTGGVPVPFSDKTPPTASQLSLSNTTAFAVNDLLLLATKEPSATANSSKDGKDSSSTSSQINASDCLIEQVISSSSSALGLGGDYHDTNNHPESLSDNSSAMVLGNVVANRPPQFMVIGVGDNNTLFSYDLLNTTGDSTRLQARADGVFELHALYGIDKNCDGKISNDEWVSPTDTKFSETELMSVSNKKFSVSALMSGSMQEETNQPVDAAARLAACGALTTANDFLQKILAIRVGLLLRTNLPEKDAVTRNNLALFSDLDGLTYTRPVKGQEQNYRYRTVELTIPLRNSLMLP